MVYKAVIFDSSGVTMSFSSMPYIQELFEHLKKDEAAWKMWADLELGKGSVRDSNILYQATLDAHPELKKQIMEAMTDDTVMSIFDNMVEDHHITTAVAKLRSAGITTCLLTNNMFRDEKRKLVYVPEEIIAKFDTSVISCRDGCRKPDADCFLLAAKRVEADPRECIFVDDFPENIAGAEAVGMTGVQVHGIDTGTAVKELEKLLNMTLH